MARPSSRAELLEAMEREYEALMAEISEMDASQRESPGACDQWSVKDLMSHLDAWHEMFLQWEEEGSAGASPEMPAAGFTWRQTPELNEQIYLLAKEDPYEEVAVRLEESYRRVKQLVESYSDDDLSTKQRYKWTGSTSVLSYAVSATSSHYEWARKLVARFRKQL